MSRTTPGDARNTHYAATISDSFLCGSQLRESGANTWWAVNCPECLRVRAEKAEAALAERREVIIRLDKEIDSWIDREERVFTQREALKAELRTLRVGIQALADEWERQQLQPHTNGSLFAVPVLAALRGLLSPTPERSTP